MIIDFATRKKTTLPDLYSRECSTIEVFWSVLSSLEAYNGKEALEMECACYGNITHYSQLSNEDIKRFSKRVPGYIRLCMLYEKQGRFADAADICKQAIAAGAVEDGNPGKMFGRLARISRKACIQSMEAVESV